MLQSRVDRFAELGDHGQTFDRTFQSLIVRNNDSHPIPERPGDERAIVTAVAAHDLHPTAHRVRGQRYRSGRWRSNTRPKVRFART